MAFQFLHLGQFLIAKESTTEDALMEIALEAGAEDVISSDDGFEVRCQIAEFDTVSHALEEAGVPAVSSEIAYIPTVMVPIDDIGLARSVRKLHDVLDDNDDVQSIFSNEEFTDEILAELDAE